MTDLFFFQLRRIGRSWQYLVSTVLLPALFTVFFTKIFGGRAGGAAEYQAYASDYMVSMMAYGALGAALGATIRLAFDRASGWLRQLRVTPMTSGAVLGADIAVGAVLVFPSLIVVGLVGRFVNGVQLDALTWLSLVAVMWAGSAAFVALGLLLGLALDERAAGGAIGILSIILAALGGLWIPVDLFPSGLAAVARVMPSSWYGQLGRDVLAGDPPLVSGLVMLGFTVLFTAGALAVARRRPLHAVAG